MNQETGQSEYTVVARRYRPQSFTEMVGQNHIAHALANAIKQNRVGHAYLFTGARGVGKTSSARIFAKCLNCEDGPTETPCNECDICQSVSVGEDIDVLEIDGASNRGIDEIRQLRSNAIVRPSRARFKIYIIDEVHMLTQQAFNALLKTLEEPPDHVKFIFCTTDPQKIPITVLSRCQRFDFSPVQTQDIIQRLREICDTEGIAADDEALSVLARRAAGSMRDSQSLLEQLLSFCSEKIGIEDVHQLLGTAETGKIKEIVAAVVSKDTAIGLNLIACAIEDGVDSGQLAAQLLGYFRDIMAVRVGASAETLLTCAEPEIDELKVIANQLGLETILAIVQVLDQCITRMQSSLHGRTLLEVALVRICNLENLDALADLVEQINAASGIHAPRPAVARSPSKKNVEQRLTADVAAAAVPKKPAGTIGESVSRVKLTTSNVREIWNRAADEAGGMTTDIARQVAQLNLIGNKIVAEFDEPHVCELCGNAARSNTMERLIEKASGQKVKIECRTNKKSAQKKLPPKPPKMTRVQMIRQLEQHEMVKSAIEVFEADVVEFKEPRSNN